MYLSLTFLKVNNSFHFLMLEMIRTRDNIVKGRRGPGVKSSQKKHQYASHAFCMSAMIGPLC